MTTESVAIVHNVEAYGAAPVLGNYTASTDMHLWCAQALATIVASPEVPLQLMNDDIQAALRFLLKSEVERAKQAQAAGAH